MAAQEWTTTELLVNIREEARIADDDPDATDEILLRKATNILHTIYVPAVRKARAEYYVIEATIPLVSEQQAYAIPRRATTGTVRRVRLVDAQGRETPLAQIPFEDIARGTGGTRPTHYAITDDRILVHPLPTSASTSCSLRIAFEYRPGTLVPLTGGIPGADAWWVSGYSWSETDGHEVQLANPATYVDGSIVDVIRKDPPFSAAFLDAVVDLTAGIPSDTLALTSFCGPQNESAGVGLYDYVCTAGCSPIPQIPPELHPVLAKHTAADWLRPIDSDVAAALKKAADDELKELLGAMQPRKQGTQMKVRPRHSMLRNVRGGRRGGGPIFGDWS